MYSSSIFLHAATIIACVMCAFVYMYTAYSYWKPKHNRFLYAVFFACIIGALNWGALFLNNAVVGFLLFWLAEAFLLSFAVHITTAQAMFAAIGSTLFTLCIQGIVIGTMALMLGKNLYQIITVQDWALIALMSTMILKALFLGAYHIRSVRTGILILLRTPKEMDSVLLHHTALLVFMLFYSYNYYYNLDLIWFSFAQIILSVLMIVLYVLSLHYGTRVSVLLEDEIMNERIHQQLNTQLSQYASYNQVFKQIESFKYQFRECSLAVDELLAHGSVDSARSELRERYPHLLQVLPSQKVFSNNELLNALLFSWENRFQAAHVEFYALVHLPPMFEKKAEELLSIFAVSENLFLYLTQAVKEPKIEISAKTVQRRFSISISCPVRGFIEQRYDLPYFMTPQADKIKPLYHKLSSIADSIDAMLVWEYNEHDHSFQIVVSIHA